MHIKYFSIGGLPLAGRVPLSLGDRHPSTAGVVGLDVGVIDNLIATADIVPGYLHRAAEKLFEVRDYRALIMLADRHDWLSSFSGELVVTQVVEKALGIVPPPRAAWLRAMLAEFGRLHSHLSFLSYICDAHSAVKLWAVVDSLRTALLDWSGNRVHPMLNRVGGISLDMPRGWPQRVAKILPCLNEVAEDLQGHLELLPPRFARLGRTDPKMCMQFGLSGPVARAAGLDMDLRPTAGPAYKQVFEPTPHRDGGDALTRFQVLVDELTTSVRMVQHALEAMPGGEHSVRLSRRLKVPEGVHLAEIEAPWGVASALLVSKGGQTPWRLALRTPTFANVSALSQVLVGAGESQIADVVASLGYGIGDLDK